MEMLVIAVVAVVAFAAVLIPLFRRATRSADDEREFATGAPTRPPLDEPIPPIAAGPATPVAPTAGGMPPVDDAAAVAAGDEIELEVQRYRVALRAGTLCPKCGQANPAESAYCFDCGRRLPLADAREFE